MTVSKCVSRGGTLPLAMGLFLFALAGCDSKPTGQASRDPEQIVNRAPSPAAGKTVDPAKSEDTMGKGAAAQPVQPVDDVALNIKVQDALKSNYALKALPILVQTTDGVVTLTGNADTPANRDNVEQLVTTIAGVKAVQNKLTIGGT